MGIGKIFGWLLIIVGIGILILSFSGYGSGYSTNMVPFYGAGAIILGLITLFFSRPKYLR